jgi:protein-arginine kinase activator protein McsA
MEITDDARRELFYCFDCLGELDLLACQFPVGVVKNDIKCGFCGMTLSKFIKTKRVGCYNDYDLFNIGPILLQYHKSDMHVGKIPYTQIISELDVLLNNAIKAENYEKAAEISDLIIGLKKLKDIKE